MSMLRELYTQTIMDHYRRPRNKGTLEDADIEEHLLNPLCGDEVTIYANFWNGKLTEVRFEGRGCSISQASASMMTERLSGKSHGEAQAEIERFKTMMVGKEEFSETDDLAALKGVIQYPSRIKCAMLAWDAFWQGLKDTTGTQSD